MQDVIISGHCKSCRAHLGADFEAVLPASNMMGPWCRTCALDLSKKVVRKLAEDLAATRRRADVLELQNAENRQLIAQLRNQASAWMWIGAGLFIVALVGWLVAGWWRLALLAKLGE